MDFEGALLAWTALAIFIPLALSVIIPGVYRTWVEYRSRSQALDVLRVYAEKGQEPPASVTSAIGAVASAGTPFVNAAPAPAGAFARPTREHHLAHVAGSVVCGLGAAGIAWWRMPDNGEPGALVIWAVIFAIFFAGSVAARLVGVFTTPSGRPRDDR
jgi:uncharacterized membrane protein HdeD (DUF308 family)